MQHFISAGELLDENGNLKEAGFSFELNKTYNKKNISANKLRVKEWDYYYVGNECYGIALTIADNNYMSLVSVSVLDFINKKEKTTTIMKPFSLGKLNLPGTTKEGITRFKNKRVSMTFEVIKAGERKISCTFKNFIKNKDFSCEITLKETNDKSMVIATPFEKSGHFYYNQKINCQEAKGCFDVGDKHIVLNKCYGVLDWGRGVWTYKNTWYWSSLSSIQKGIRIGWNLGYGFGDTSKASENILFYDDTAYKLEDVSFVIPHKGKKDLFLKDWLIVSKDKTIDLTFHPILNRHAYSNALIIKSNQNQVFGYFNGTIKVNNQIININNLLGFAEKVKNVW